MTDNEKGLEMREAILKAQEMGSDVAIAVKTANDAIKIADEMKTELDETVQVVSEVNQKVSVLLPAFAQALRFTTESSRITLVQFPYDSFPEWEFTPNREFDNGEVARMGFNKWLNLADGTRLNQGQTPETDPRFLLHRDPAAFDPDGKKRIWIREEFNLLGTWRWDEQSNQSSQHGWYEVTSRLVASATPPFNDSANWAFRGKEEPPDA